MKTFLRPLRNSLPGDLQRLLRPLLVIGLLLLSTAPAYAAQRQLALVLAAVMGAGLLAAFLRWPSFGLTVAALAGMVVPYVGPSGLNATMILVAVLLGLWLLDVVVRRRPIEFASSRTVAPLLAFLGIAALSVGVGQLPWFTFAPHAPLGAQLGGFSIAVLSAGVFLLSANHMNDLGGLRRMTWTFLAVAALSVLSRSVLPAFGLATPNWFQPMGSAFFIWLVAMAFSQAAFNRDLHPGWRAALGGLVLIAVYLRLALNFEDKSGWIPLLACIAATIGSRSWRAGLALVPAIAMLALYLAPTVLASDEYSVSTRYEAWSIMARIVEVSPLWGLGFANYYWVTPLFPIRGYAVSFNSHNNYLDIVAQTGLAGLACFVWFMWEVGRLGWRLRAHAPSGFARAYVHGSLGGLAGAVVVGMLGDWVLPFFYNIGMNGFRSSMLTWLFLGGLVGLEGIVRSPGRGGE